MKRADCLGDVRIGVLGGIGPESTGLFYNRLIRGLQNKCQIISNKDYPHIIINSIPAKELLSDRYDERDLEEYIRGIKELEQIGVDFIVMACNTIYYYYELLQGQTRVPILDLRKEVSRALERKKVRSVTVIGTPITIIRRLYKVRNVIHKRPSSKEINQLSEAIYNFNKGFQREKQIRFVVSLVSKYRGESDAILIACTELSAMLDKFEGCIDTLNILADSTIERTLKLASQNHPIK